MLQCGVITIVGLVIGGTFHGLIPQTRKHKSTPNQGILLTAYYCLRYGVILGVFAGGLWGLCIYMIYDRLPKVDKFNTELIWAFEERISLLPVSESAKAGLTVGLFGGFGVYIVAGIWFGGLDVMRHYVLRLMLAAYGYLPLRLKTFLAYVERDLTFLDRVGGGYRFIHRYLLEYFASSPLDGAGQAGASKTHMVRRTRMQP